jgi:hypothetical protein
LAWRFIASKLKQRIPGEYHKNLLLGRSDANTCKNDIHKDIYRTFPELSYFNNAEYGTFGQAQLQNVLEAYSVFRPEVGYC